MKVLAAIQARAVKPKKQEAVYKWTPQAKQKAKPSLPAAWNKQAAVQQTKATAEKDEEDEEMKDIEQVAVPVLDEIGLQAPMTPKPLAAKNNVLMGDPPNFQAMIEAAIRAAIAPLQQQINTVALAVKQQQEQDSDDDSDSDGENRGVEKGGKGKPPAPPATSGNRTTPY